MSQSPSAFRRCFELLRRQPGRYTAIAILPHATLYPALLFALWCFLTNTTRATGESPSLRAIWTGMTFTDKLEFDLGFLL